MTTRTIKVNIDAAGAKRGAAQANAALRSIGNGAGSAQRGMDAARKAMASAAQASKSASQNMAGLSAAMRGLNAATQLSATALHANTAALDRNTAALLQMQSASAKAKTSTDRHADGLSRLGAILGGLSFTAAIAGAVHLTDAYALMAAKLGIAVQGLGDSGKAMEDVSRIAATTRSGLDDVAALYSKVSFAGKDLGTSQAAVSRTTETVAKALKVSGASAQETSSTILQLGQALASGKLQGEEFRAMSENAPRLMRMLADSTKLPVGALKALGSEGKITSEMIIKAFTDSRLTGALDDEFAKIPKTFADNLTLAKNGLEEYLGQNATAVAGSRALGDALSVVTKNLDIVIPSVVALSTALGVGLVTNMVAARVAAGGLGSAMLGAFGGPIGLAVTGLALGIGAYAIEANKADAIVAAVAATHERLNTELDKAAGAAKTLAGETRGVGTDSESAIQHVDNFAGATGRAAQALYEQAHAARQARKEILKKQLAESQGQERSLAAILPGGRQAATDRSWSALWEGDFSAAFDPSATMAGLRNWWSGGRTDRENSAAYGKAVQNSLRIQDQLDHATNDPLGKGDLPVVAPPIPGKPDKKSNKKTDAQRSAEAVRDYWQQLEKARDVAAELPISAQQVTKEYELQKAYAIATGGVIKALSDDDKKRLATLLQQARAGELLRDLTAAANDAKAANDAGKADFEWTKKTLGLSEDALNIAQSTRDWTVRAGREGVDLADAKYQLQLKTLEAAAKETFERERQSKLLKNAPSTIAKYDPRTTQANDLRSLDQEGQSIMAAIKALEAIGPAMTDDQRRLLEGARRARDANIQATQVVADRFRFEFADRISVLGQQFGGAFGSAIENLGSLLDGLTRAKSGDFSGLGPAGGLINLFGSDGKGGQNRLGKAAQRVFSGGEGEADYGTRLLEGLKSPLTSIGKGFDDLGQDFNDIFKKGGDFQKGVGSIMGKVGAGQQIGGTIAGLSNALGLKMSSGGAQIGGAIGGLAGPIGAVAGSIVGGITGNLLKKAKYSTSTISRDANGDLSSNTKGNSSSREKVTTGAAGSINQGLDAIAAQLGGVISGTPTVSIGTYKDKWRVSDIGRTGKLKGGSGRTDIKDFGKDGQGDAIEYAIRVALEQNVLSGVSAFSSKLLKSTVDLDKAVSIATQWEGVVTAIKAYENPIAGAVDALLKPINTLRQQMVQYGATADDIAQIDKYRAIELDKLRKSELQGVQDIRDFLNGEGSGRTALTRLNAELAKFDAMKADIDAGKTVDQDAYAALVQKVQDLNVEVYGTATAQSQNIWSRLVSTTDALGLSIEKAFDTALNIDPVVTATQETNNLMAVNNDLALQQLQVLQVIASSLSVSGGGTSRAVNGVMNYV